MADKKKTKKVVKKASTVLLRNASTGVFYEGEKPAKAGSPSGTKGGVPFWEV